MAGRPTKLSDEVKDKLVDAISQGNYYEAACAYAGISYSTLREWINKGEEEGAEKEFSDFSEAIKKAEADAEVAMVKAWQKHIPNNWQAIATFMERRYPDRWGRKDRSQVEHAGQFAVRIIDNIPKEEDDGN